MNDATTDKSIWDPKGYLTLGELSGLFVIGVLGVGLFVILANNLGRWVGSLVNDTLFEWGLPSITTLAWYSVAMVAIFSGVAAANAQRLWKADGGWSPRVLANILVCGLGFVAAAIFALGLIAGSI